MVDYKQARMPKYKELFMKSVEENPNVYYQKLYVNEETEQKIIYIHVKK